MASIFSFTQLALDDLDRQYDQLAAQAGGHLTQSSMFGRWQQALGRPVILGWWQDQATGQIAALGQIIGYDLKFGQRILYCPHGPIFLTLPTGDLLQAMAQTFNTLGQTHRAIAVRFNPGPVDIDIDNKSKLFRLVNKKQTASFMQPAREWVSNINLSSLQIWHQLPGSTRRAIRQSRLANLRSEIVDRLLSRHLDTFYHLLTVTANRHSFSLHPKSYYAAILNNLDQNQAGWLVMIYHQGQPIVANLIVGYGQVATYLFGGSDHNYHHLQASYLAQWIGLIETKARGFKQYSFGGISTDDWPSQNWQGLTRFKQKFSGQVTKFSSSYDFPLKPIWYYTYLVYKYFNHD